MVTGLPDDFYDQVAQRIRDRCHSSVVSAETGLNPTAAYEALAVSAALVVAVVAPLGDQAAPIREASMRVTQTEVTRFGVTMALAWPGGFPEFSRARADIRRALRGWGEPWMNRPVEYAGGRLLQYSLAKDGGRWLHLLEFRLEHQETYEHQS